MRSLLRKIINKIRGVKGHEWKITKTDIAKYLPVNPIVIEAGVSHGYDTVEMSKLWEKGVIYGFEPEPNMYQDALKNTKECKNVFLFPFALGEKKGKSKYYVSTNKENKEITGSGSLLTPKKHLEAFPHIEFKKEIEVDVINLADWVSEKGLGTIDLLWLDLQGYEYNVLRSSEGLLNKVKVLFTEVSFQEVYEGALLYDDFRKWLNEYNFFPVKEEKYEAMGNVLFINKTFYE